MSDKEEQQRLLGKALFEAGGTKKQTEKEEKDVGKQLDQFLHWQIEKEMKNNPNKTAEQVLEEFSYTTTKSGL